MRDPGLPSLDQLRVFIAVIDHGGFAHAARALHRTQSVISYTIANLEEQLNVELLDRSKRKPTLTEAGKALLADARAVSLKVDGMRARAKALSAGLVPILTNIPPFARLLRKAGLGYFYDPDDPVAEARRIDELASMHDGHLREEAMHAAASYGWEAVTASYVDLYRHLAARSQAWPRIRQARA